MQFVLVRFYLNMGEVVHERDEPRLARRGDIPGAKILEDRAAKRIPGC
jgi:hypothetical protein